MRCLNRAVFLAAGLCGVLTQRMTTTEEERVLSQELTIWYLREPALISESPSNPGFRKRKIRDGCQLQPRPNQSSTLHNMLLSFYCHNVASLLIPAKMFLDPCLYYRD